MPACKASTRTSWRTRPNCTTWSCVRCARAIRGPSRAVMDPRGVLRDFGVELPDHTEIRVWDSTAEMRYLVLPMRPLGTESWSEERLAAIVTRDSMIGTGLPRLPDGTVP